MDQRQMEAIAQEAIRERGQICGIGYVETADYPNEWLICVHCIDGQVHTFCITLDDEDTQDTIKQKIKEELGDWLVEPPTVH